MVKIESNRDKRDWCVRILLIGNLVYLSLPSNPVNPELHYIIGAIHRLLRRDAIVKIDGLGEIKLIDSSAQIQRGSNVITAPTSQLVFNENKEEKSKVLENELIQFLGINRPIAQNVIQSFKESLVESILVNRRFPIEGLGELSVGEDSKIYFTQSNYLAVLPKVRAVPVSRSVENKKEIINALDKKTDYSTVYYDDDQSGFNVWPWLFGAALILVSILFWKSCVNDAPENPKKTNLELVDISSADDKTTGSENSVKPDQGSEHFENVDSADQEVEYTSQTLECIIVVGTFKKAKNILKMRTRVENKGLTLYEEITEDGLTRVGFTFDCTDEDLPDYLRDVRKQFNTSAWYLTPSLEVY